MTTQIGIHPHYFGKHPHLRLSGNFFSKDNSNSVALHFSSGDPDDWRHAKTEITAFGLDAATAEGLHLFAEMSVDQRAKALVHMKLIKNFEGEK